MARSIVLRAPLFAEWQEQYVTLHLPDTVPGAALAPATRSCRLKSRNGRFAAALEPASMAGEPAFRLKSSLAGDLNPGSPWMLFMAPASVPSPIRED